MAFDATDHAPEIAGFAAVVAVIVPWSVSFASGGFSGSVVLRFVFGSVEVGFGARSADMTRRMTAVTELGARYEGLTRVATLWLIAAALLVVALLLGFGLFVAGERLAGPLDPVRVMGVLCLCMALVLSGAAWLLFQQTPRAPIPVGVVALYLFGGGLLTIDRSRAGHATAETSG